MKNTKNSLKEKKSSNKKLKKRNWKKKELKIKYIKSYLPIKRNRPVELRNQKI